MTQKRVSISGEYVWMLVHMPQVFFCSLRNSELPQLPGTRWLQQQPLAFDSCSEAQQGECEENTKGSKAEEFLLISQEYFDQGARIN